MNKIQLFIGGLALSCLPAAGFSASDSVANAQCGDPVQPLLSVSDFNGDGKVTYKDIHMLKDALREHKYYSVFDRNADGQLNHTDLHLAKKDLHSSSSLTDQQLAKMYQRFKHFQNVSGFDTIQSMNFQPFGSVLAFHGQHWANYAGQFASAGLAKADQFLVEGINVMADGSSVPAIYWGEGTVPLFNDPTAPGGLSTLDWPSPGGVWNFERVQAFAGNPPDFFPETTADRWHPHAGLCVTMQDLGNGPEWVVDQYTSNAECQATPNLQKVEFNGQKLNIWGNFWMLHAWLYELNPRGVFGNVHPCIDPTGASEEDLNGGREIPPFFQAIMSAP